MSSYYGGKPGKSFIIVETFDSIASMTAKFALGPAYTDVAFDEYVIINTQHKHNPENGQIFRRGYDYNSDRKIMNYQLVQDDKKQNQKYEAVAISAFGAIYVGTIAGPAGRAPQLNLTTYENIAFNEITEEGQPETFSISLADDLGLALYPDDQAILNMLNQKFPQGEGLYKENSLRPFYAVKIDINENRGDNHIVEYHYYCCDNTILNDKTVYSAGWYQVASAPSYGIGSYTLEDNNLAYGVTYGENIVEPDEIDGEPNPNKGQEHLNPDTYQDTIDWKYMTVVNENHEDATAFIGFKFPIPISEFEVTSVDPYYHRNDREDTTIFQNINLLDRVSTNTGDKVHPFYHKYNINIPKGIKGDCINNFRILETGADIANIDVPEVDEDNNLLFNENGSLKVRNYGKTEEEKDDIDNSRQVIVYDYTTYNRVAEGDTYTFYLGDYNTIVKDSFNVDNEGTITIDYTHEDQDTFTHKIDWINDIKFDDDGTVTVIMNNPTLFENGVLSNPQLINWINEIEFTDTGTIRIKMNNATTVMNKEAKQELLLEDFITWLTKVSLDKENGHLDIEFNNNRTIADIHDDLTWVKKIAMDKEGSISYEHTTSTNDRIDEHFVKWIEEINFNNDGTIYLKMNNDNAILNDEARQELTLTQFITWLTQLELDEETGLLEVKFNNETQTNAKSFSKNLTWVKDIQLSEDGTLTFTKTTEVNTLPQELNWIDSFTFNSETGEIDIKFNNENISNINHILNYIKSASIEQNHLYLTHSNPAIGVEGKDDLGPIPCTIASKTKPDNFDTYANGSIWFKLEEE